MRWPLRNQVLLPMSGLMLISLVAVSVLNAYLSVRHTRERIERDVAEVTTTVAMSNFPLTNGVLRQMRGLAGADLVLTDRLGQLIASSTADAALVDLAANTGDRANRSLALAKPISVGKGRFFHAAIQLDRGRRGAMQPAILHVFYPEESYLQASRDVFYPPLMVGAIAIVLVIGLSLGIASRVARPLRRLQSQVDQIAEGDFRSVPVPARNDEIADLSKSINRMATMLAHYESEIRRSEQLRTLGQLGGGIAHQIRNSVTGCRLAVELHDRECPLKGNADSLDVAKRQLELMEKYLQRFLSLGRTQTRPHTTVDLNTVVENVISLVRPTAKHVGVELHWNVPTDSITVSGDSDALEQLFVNLLLNAIEAAQFHQVIPPDLEEANTVEPHGHQQCSSKPPVHKVVMSLRPVGERVEFEICDTGPGPAANVRTRLFEPFVTEKPDGTGLGLTVASNVAVAHGGQLRWYRCDGQTCFVLELPNSAESRERT